MTSAPLQRRVLIISTTFFPDPTVSAIRMTQWCRHLARNGWKPYVLCRYYGYESPAEEFADRVHPNVTLEYLDKSSTDLSDWSTSRWRILRRFAGAVFAHLGIASVFVPDVSILFWRRNRERILARVMEIKPDLIITTSPPHSNHEIGLWLAAQTGIPWVADFRDPYLLDVRFKPVGLGKLRQLAHRRFERSIYRRAWLITHAIPIHARWARRYYPFARDRVRVLTNGFPLELLDELPREGLDNFHRQTVLVTGTIPKQEEFRLAEAVALIAREGHNVELKLVGKTPIDEGSLREVLGDRLVVSGYLPHTETVRDIAKADVLVSFLDDFRSRTLLLSTKLIEYLGTNKAVICVNPSRSERFLLWRRAGVEVMHQPSTEELASRLKGCLTESSQRDPEEVKHFRKSFTWTERVRELDVCLRQLVDFPPKMEVRVQGDPVASVVIPCRNRKDILRQTIRSSLAQSVPVEVIVMDDGSTDGTVEMVREEYPSVRLYQLGQKKGPAFQRNRGISLARSSIVFPIDDDSIFSSPKVVEQTLAEFNHPRVAAVGIPFLNPRLDWEPHQTQPQSVSGIAVVHAFVGAAHAVRKGIFLEVGGYREHFFYMGEEGDLCIRLIKRGYVVRLGNADPIYHLESPRRDNALAGFCGRRNDVLFAWHNVPTPFLPLHLAITTMNGLYFSLTSANPIPMLRGILSGYIDCWEHRYERTPVSGQIYRLQRRLKKKGPANLDELEHLLPKLPSSMVNDAHYGNNFG
jgi:glycosyltransferase involved in cell wall biosynthesis